jgi:alpha-galactosidase
MWLPIEFGQGDEISISWKDSWWVDTLTGNMGQSASKLYEITSPEAVLVGDAIIVPCTGCSEGDSVGYIGYEGRLRFEGLTANITSDYSVLIGYANGDSSPRFLSVNVNGVFNKNVTFPTTETGQTAKQLVIEVPLRQGNANNIEFYNDNGFGPDIDFIRVGCYYNPC